MKILLWSLLALMVVVVSLLGGFIYKIKYGFPVMYETEAPALVFPPDQKRVLLFSKTTGFRHGESIDASKEVFADLASANGWFLFATEEGGVFNSQQLPKFDVVIFNNSTGRVLSDDQRAALKTYVEDGGTWIGIHGAGDDSHHWDWYVQNLVGAQFSHHSMDPQLQETQVVVSGEANSLLTAGLPNDWTHTDEWYVFVNSPSDKGFEILCSIDGESIATSGNVLWIKNKDFGMGAKHPVAWYRSVGEGQAFYTSMGHHGAVWDQPAFVRLIENAVKAY